MFLKKTYLILFILAFTAHQASAMAGAGRGVGYKPVHRGALAGRKKAYESTDIRVSHTHLDALTKELVAKFRFIYVNGKKATASFCFPVNGKLIPFDYYLNDWEINNGKIVKSRLLDAARRSFPDAPKELMVDIANGEKVLHRNIKLTDFPINDFRVLIYILREAATTKDHKP